MKINLFKKYKNVTNLIIGLFLILFFLLTTLTTFLQDNCGCDPADPFGREIFNFKTCCSFYIPAVQMNWKESPINLLITATVPAASAQTEEEEEEEEEEIELPSPLGEVSVEIIIGRVIRAILGVVGAIALLMFVYGGFTWLTSGGNPDKIKKGKEIIIWAILGLVVIFASYTLVSLIIETLTI